jgi:hypothetical protein
MKKRQIQKVSVSTSVEKTVEVREGDRYVSMTFDSDWTTISYDSNMPQKKTLEDWRFLIKALKIMFRELERNRIP